MASEPINKAEMAQTRDASTMENDASANRAASIARAPENATSPTMATLLGEIVWLLTQSPAHRHLFITDLEWSVIPALKLRQVHLFRSKGRIVGLAIWAKVSEEVDKRLSSGINRLAPNEWNSGENLWLVDIIAPLGGVEHLLSELKSRYFPNEPMKVIVTSENGKRTINTI